jgi:hypothetical protein
MDAAVTVRETTIPSGIRLVDSPQRADVTIYPDQVHRDRGGYHPDTLAIADELRRAGIDAQPWHDLAHCDVAGERGPITDAVLSLVLGIASAAGWDAIKALLRRRTSNDPVKLTIGWRTTQGEQWLNIEGPAHAIADTLNNIEP